jgi:hypothetical protein
MEQSNVSAATATPCKKKEKLSICLTNQALPHEGVWGSECTSFILVKKKVKNKGIPLRDHGSLYGCEMLRIS